MRPVVAAAITIALGGCSMFHLDQAPEEVDQMFRGMGDPGTGCTPIARKAARMARAELPSGGVAELWIAPTNEGGSMEVVVEKSPEGDGMGASGGGCGSGAAGNGISWSGGMATFDDQDSSGWVILSGHVMSEAESVRVNLEGEDPIVLETQVDGYFMGALEITSMEEMNSRSWPDSIDALDADGDVIASLDLADFG